MSPKYNFKNIDFVNFFFLFLTPIAAVISSVIWIKTSGFHWGQLLMAIAFYFATGMSITAGYHRLFAHKAYSAHPFIKFLYLIFGAAAFENSVLKWGSDHRVHHQKVDTEDDPYNINEGFFHAHMGWVFLKKNGQVHEKYVKDFLSDKLVMWQHKYYLLISVATGIALPTILGGVFFDSFLGGFAMGAMTRIVFTHHCTFFINSLCHCLGTSPYTDTNSAKDSWFMALLTFGEGYHNFHHFFQTDYRNGVRWFHFDPTKWLIKTLNLMGLAEKLKLTPEDRIIAARMQMKAKLLKSKTGDSSEKFLMELDKLKTQALESYQKWQELKDEYKRLKGQQAADALNELKENIRCRREEFETLFEQWEFLVKNYMYVQPLIKA